MENFFAENLKKLTDKYSQKQVAIDTCVSPASINNYINRQSDPSAGFLLKLKEIYNISIDEFLTETTDFDKTSGKLSKDFKRFEGDYIVYFYDTNVYKGRVSYSTNILKYGIITIFYEPNLVNRNACLANGVFLGSRTEADNAFKALSSMKSGNEKKEFYAAYTDRYSGTMEQSVTQLFINLKNVTEFDRCSIILNNPPSTNIYIGGLGVVSSVARGRERMPCIQYMLFARNSLKLPDGELYQMLALGTPEVSIHNESEQLIDLFRNLYMVDEQNPNHLNDYQKKRIMEDSLSNIISDVVEANIFRFAKISNMEDDHYFRLLREVADDDDE